MEYVYILRHDYEIREGDVYKDYETFIGIYSTEESCKQAIDKIKDMEQFKGREEYFNYAKVKINRDRVGWSDGFVDLSLEDAK